MTGISLVPICACPAGWQSDALLSTNTNISSPSNHQLLAMDTIVQRRLHNEAQALSIMREQFRTYLQHYLQQQQEEDAATAPPPVQRRQGRGGRKKTESALRAQAYQALAANPTLRAELAGTATTTSTRSWSDLLAFFPSPDCPIAVRFTTQELRTLTSSFLQMVEAEQKAGRLPCYKAAQQELPLLPPARRRRRQQQRQPEQQQHNQQQQQQQQQQAQQNNHQQEHQHHYQQRQRPPLPLGLIDLPKVLVEQIFASYLDIVGRIRWAAATKAAHDWLDNTTDIFKNIVIPENAISLGPRCILRLLELARGNALSLDIKRNTGGRIEGASYGVALDVEAYDEDIEREKIVLARLTVAVAHQRILGNLCTLKFQDKPRWLSRPLFMTLLRNVPRLETLYMPFFDGLRIAELKQVLDSGALSQLQHLWIDLRCARAWNDYVVPHELFDGLPALRHLTFTSPANLAQDEGHIFGSGETLRTMDMYNIRTFDYQMPSSSLLLEHLRLRICKEDHKVDNYVNFTPPPWNYPRLRVLDMHFSYCSRVSQITQVIASGCPSLEYVFLSFEIRGPRMESMPPQDLGPLLALPRLFYLLVREDVWDLSRLPEGWVAHQSRRGASNPHVLEPANVFVRPIEVEYPMIALFRRAKSPVAYGVDSAEWRWTNPWARPWRGIYTYR